MEEMARTNRVMRMAAQAARRRRNLRLAQVVKAAGEMKLPRQGREQAQAHLLRPIMIRARQGRGEESPAMAGLFRLANPRAVAAGAAASAAAGVAVVIETP